MNFSPRPSSSGLGGYREVLHRRWAIVLDLAALGLFAAAVFVTTVPQVYTATASVSVPAQGGGGIILLPVLVPGPYGNAQAARSIKVARIARQMLHSSLSPLALAGKVTVTVSPNSQGLDITCRAPTAVGAAAGANAFAAAYLRNRGATAAASLNAQVKTLQGQVTALQKSISTLNTQIAGLPSNSPTRISDQQTVSTDKTQLNSLNQQMATLQKALSQTSGGHVITAASLPGKPTSPNKTLVLSAIPGS